MQLAQKPPPPSESKHSDLGPLIQSETLRVLVEASLVQESEKSGFDHYLTASKVHAGNILPVMAELRQIDETSKGIVIEKWARAMSPILKKRFPLIPFANRLLATTTIYEKYPELKEWAETSCCPLIFAEDSDVLGFGMLNPVAGVELAQKVEAFFREKEKVVPFVSLFLIPLKSWEFICERQFGK